MKLTWKVYALAVLLTELVGIAAGWLTRDGILMFNVLVKQPPLTPPQLVFPIAWTILYALMGIGAARVSAAEDSFDRSQGLWLFGVQLFFNFCWSIVFFNLQWYGFAALWLIAMEVLIVLMTLAFRRVDRLAAVLQLPYILWVSFALYLNVGVWWLN